MEATVNSSLLEICNLIADQGADYARQHEEFFLEVVKERSRKEVSEEQIDAILKVFFFLNWAYVNGVWSNITDTVLRRGLMAQSMKSIVLKTAHELSENKTNEAVAFLAVQLDQEFRGFVFEYTKRMEELSRDGFEPDANSATLWGLESIQRLLNLSDEDMNIIVTQFNRLAGDVAKIEEIAKQLNRSVTQRRKGFFSRLFGS
jgi:hypothetical protein